MNFKTLHKDTEPDNVIEVTAEEFLNRPKPEPIELIEQPAIVQQQPAKKSKAWIWVIVIIIVLIAVTIAYKYVREKQLQNNG